MPGIGRNTFQTEIEKISNPQAARWRLFGASRSANLNHHCASTDFLPMGKAEPKNLPINARRAPVPTSSGASKSLSVPLSKRPAQG
jgi:hypothetical protein